MCGFYLVSVVVCCRVLQVGLLSAGVVGAEVSRLGNPLAPGPDRGLPLLSTQHATFLGGQTDGRHCV